ncbi:hypothetical protein H4W30_002914 [Amycolatopsis roodepoortensis]|uniref:Uncharacterized protein n=1 Tax=Amycolatopsis roodepoortensis TaxID=700274 RepID=A0ABR9L664_9PSEU|nr:hypothetical protein [Amycolatopsis roodepoortensis]
MRYLLMLCGTAGDPAVATDITEPLPRLGRGR